MIILVLLTILDAALIVALHFELQWFKKVFEKTIKQHDDYLVAWCNVLDTNYAAMMDILRKVWKENG